MKTDLKDEIILTTKHLKRSTIIVTGLAAFSLALETTDAVTLSINEASAPTEYLTASTQGGSFTRAFHSHSTLGKTTRGSTLKMPDTGDDSSGYLVTGLTMKKNVNQTFATGDTLQLWVFAWNPSTNGSDMTSWVLGDGMDPTNGGDSDPLDGTGCTLLVADTFDIGGQTLTNGTFFTFDFSSSPLRMFENTAYGFLLGYIDGGGTGADNFQFEQINIGSYAYGTQIRTQNIPSINGVDMLIKTTFYVTGEPMPTGTLVLLR